MADFSGKIYGLEIIEYEQDVVTGLPSTLPGELYNADNGDTPPTPSATIINLFRGFNGADYVYFRSDEARPPGLTNVVIVNSFVE